MGSIIRLDAERISEDPLVYRWLHLMALEGGRYRLVERSLSFGSDRDWMTVKEARELLGPGFTRSLYPLLGELLVYRKPLKALIHISRTSVLALRDAFQARSDFWTNKAAQAAVRSAVQKEMDRLVASSLEQ